MKEELDVEIDVEETQLAESPVFPAANDPTKTVKLLYYFCTLRGAPNLIEDVEELQWFSKEQCLSDDFDFASSTKKFLIPLLVENETLK